MKCAILLAAGASSRTSRPKQLFEVAGKPLVRYQAERLLASGAEQVIVVVGYHADAVCGALGGDPRIGIVANPHPEEGMFSSLRCGIAAALPCERLLIHPVDVPLPSSGAIAGLWDADAPIAVVQYEGRRGHPVALDGGKARELLRSDADRLDRWLDLCAGETAAVPTAEECVVCNANTDAQLAQLFGKDST